MRNSFYLAGSFSRRLELKRYAATLEARGHHVTARWLAGGHDDLEERVDDIQRRKWAEEDLEDLGRANVMLAFTGSGTTRNNRGGRHVEFGYALARGMQVHVIGPRENVFYCLPRHQHDNWAAFLDDEVCQQYVPDSEIGARARMMPLVWLCDVVADRIYSTTPPSASYRERVVRLLMGTAAHESQGFRFRRQMGVTAQEGGYGLWQVERISIEESVRRLWARLHILGRVQDLLDESGVGISLHYRGERVPLLMVQEIADAMMRTDRLGLHGIEVAAGDIVSCVFARLHYLWVPEPIPDSTADQAVYWKAHYNTDAGRGQAAAWLASWDASLAGVFDPTREHSHATF